MEKEPIVIQRFKTLDALEEEMKRTLAQSKDQFCCELKTSNARQSDLYIPKEFADYKNLKQYYNLRDDERKYIYADFTLRVDRAICKGKGWAEKRWDIRVRYETEGDKNRTIIGSNFLQFKRENKLQRDSIILKFIDSPNKEFVLVGVFRVNRRMKVEQKNCEVMEVDEVEYLDALAKELSGEQMEVEKEDPPFSPSSVPSSDTFQLYNQNSCCPPALTTSSSGGPNDPDLQLASKKKRVENTDNNLELKRIKTSAILLNTAYESNDSLEREPVRLIYAPTMEANGSPSIGVLAVSSDGEGHETNHPVTSPILTPSPSGLALAHKDEPSPSKVISLKYDCGNMSSLFADLSDLLQPTLVQHSVDSAKNAIRRILCQGFAALSDSEAQKAFLASIEVLLEADVFAADIDLKTRLKALMTELPQNASTFLQAQNDIQMASKLSSLQEFLSAQAAKFHIVEKRLCMAHEKLARRTAKLEAALEEQAKMNEAVEALVEETTVAKLKLASLTPHAANIESKNLAAKEFVQQCNSSWGDLKATLLKSL